MTVAGRVTSVEGEPIAGAAIRLHSMTGTSDERGCFRLNGADALPFDLDVVAAGFKPLSTDAKSGAYQVEVLLAPEHSSHVSTAKWTKSRGVPPLHVPGCT